MEVQPERSKFARRGAFHRPDKRGLGTELEVSQLIAAHARWLKPSLVIETGTFHADTATLILQALNENAREGFPAEFRTYETDEDAHRTAVTRLELVDPHERVRMLALQHTLQTDASELTAASVDLAFVDSAYNARLTDIATLAPLMAPLGLLFVHDAQMKGMHATMRRLRDANEWSIVEYATPRGLALLQRRPG